MIDFDVSDDFERVVHEFGGTAGQIKTASNRAILKTMKNTERFLKQAISKDTNIAQSHLKARAKLKVERDAWGRTAVLWIGLNPFLLDSLGDIKISKNGIKVGKHARSGAFIIDFGQGDRVGIRESSEHYDENEYGYLVGKTLRNSSKGRFPVGIASISIDEAGEEAAEDAMGDVSVIFGKHFEHELNYEVNVK
ncbi:MAG: hypothetical protein OCC45_08305 [Desulfotalea sp.]